MNSQVMIDREFLERIHRDLDACQKVIWLGLRGADPSYCADAQAGLKEIDELLATPTPIPDHLPDATKMVSPITDAGEGVEVVGHILIGGVTDGEMDDNDLDFSSRMLEEIQARCVTPDPQSLPVMLVSQHTHIVSALQSSAMVVPEGWIAVSDRLPEVPEGEEQEVIVCVKRAHNGESYVFSARYLNAFLLYNDDIDDESTTATGWHDVKEHSEYDGWYSKLIDDGSGDEVTHWMPLAASPTPGDSK